MDKNAIKKYAVWARTELIDRVRQRAVRYEVTVDANPNADSASGKVLTPIEKSQRQAAIARMRDKGYDYVIEEVAYTWFNRFAALRYMEVNNYLPSRVRVFTDENGSFKPQILAEAIHLNLDGLDMEKVYALKEAEKNDELYKYLIVTQCNSLSSILPGMFQKIDDYTELLFPDNLLREGSVVEQMVTRISEDNWLDAVQIIGWLYQYYNSEPKDKVFADLKKNIKITKENIPAATQLFTPDWIVRYMVENSLGRLWLEGHPQNEEEFLPTQAEQAAYIAGDRNSEDSKWHYYLKEAEQEPEVQAKLAEIRKEYSALKPEDILCIDPCMGSGHIIVYMFDVLMKIYAAYGYSTRESVQSIIENNLYGLDIDDRAAQLAYFAVMMKAVQYDNRFLKRSEIPQPHVYAIKESNHLDSFAVEYFCNGNKKLTSALNTLITEMHDATEYGSILNISQVDFAALYARFDEINSDISMFRDTVLNELLPLVQVAQALAQKYDVAVTNPPYMGASGMSGKLSDYIRTFYQNGKSDLFAVFMLQLAAMLHDYGIAGMMTSYTWLYLTSFTKLRKDMLNMVTFQSLVQPEYHAFFDEAYVSICAFSFCKALTGEAGTFFNLSNFYGADLQPAKLLQAIDCNYKCDYVYISSTKRFELIPNSPLAYWASKNVLEAFTKNKGLGDVAEVRKGMSTANDDVFLKLWFEPSATNISFLAKPKDAMWFPITKGGEFRRWYGNNSYVVNWKDNGKSLKAFQKAVLRNQQYYFRPVSLTWTYITSYKLNFRINHLDCFTAAGPCVFTKKPYTQLALLNSTVAQYFVNMLGGTTLTYEVGEVSKIPFLDCEEHETIIEELVKNNIIASKKDWDSFEISWDFQCHPLIRPVFTLAEAFSAWSAECDERFNQLQANEEELNRIFIDIYGLQNELTPEVEDKDVTVRKADLQRDIKSLISYAVGCMFGRYSLDKEGLAYAGGEWNAKKYKTFPADKDNIIPICDDEYFDDDITGLFVKFVETVYGVDTLNENLKFIADALGGKGTPKEVIRNYFLNDFFADHCKIYQKRPIYWLFDSGKKNGFKALIYMHRYQPDTIARMRTDYVHEQQSRYRTAIADLENRIAGTSTSERVRLTKQLSKLQDQSAEIHTYEEKIHHLADRMIAIDLDDGVKHNYEIFKDVLANIK